MNDKPEGGHSWNSARKFEEDEEEPQLPTRQDSDSVDDESNRMEDDGGAQRSTPSSSVDSFRSPERLLSFHRQAQQQQQDPRTGDQIHAPIHHHIPPFILPKRRPNFAMAGPPERPRSPPRLASNKRIAYVTRIQKSLDCGMPCCPERGNNGMPMGSTRPRPFLPGEPPAHAADRLQRLHQPQPCARNTDAAPEGGAGGAADGAGALRNGNEEEVGYSRARRHAIRVVQQHIEGGGGGGGGGQTRQQAAAGRGQRQTATVRSQQPANQVQHPHDHTPSPLGGGRVGEVKGVVDPRVSSSEGEEDDH